MLLSAARSQLLIVDIQEKFMPALHAPESLVENCTRLIEAAKIVDAPITCSEQYPKGLGPTIAALKEAMGNAPRFEKVHFSCAKDADLARHIESLADQGRDQLVLTGIESHVCVLQTALDFKARGLAPVVVMDAVTSRRAESVEAAARRLQTHGIETVTSEMVLFEWMEKAGTDIFKAISALVK